jgi:hypothetical protein
MLTHRLFASSAASRALAPAAAALLVGLATALSACGGSQVGGSGTAGSTAAAPSAEASPATATAATPAPAPATSPAVRSVAAVDQEKIAHQIYVGDRYPTDCNWKNRAVCPVTDRLAARLTELAVPPPNGPGQVSLFCRCQNQAESWQVTTEQSAEGGVDHVTLNYGPALHVKIDLMVVNVDGKLLVDDTRCTGRGADTSLYAQTLAGCA